MENLGDGLIDNRDDQLNQSKNGYVKNFQLLSKKVFSKQFPHILRSRIYYKINKSIIV